MKSGRKTMPCVANVVLSLILVSMAGCGGTGQSGGGGQPSSPDFSLSLSSTGLSLAGGSSAQVSASVNGTNGFTSVVTLQISGLPAGITYSPAALQVNPGSSVKITFTAATGLSASQENAILTGTSGNLSHGAALRLTVTATSPAPVLSQIFPPSTTVGVPQGAIVLTGINFTPSSTVLFDGARANASFESSTSIQLQLDPSISGVAKSHTVQVSDPFAGNSNVLTYNVYSPQDGPLLFAGQQTLPFNQNATEQGTLADVNGDGRSDLISFDTAYGTGAAQMSIRFGQQDGSFSDPVVINVTLTNGIPGEVLAGDLTVGGHIDLILIYSGSYQVLLNDGSANFTPAGSGALPGSNFGRGAVGDFNGDGRLDFVIDTGGLPPLAMLFGNGDGTFETPVQVGSGSQKAARVEAVDLNGDGFTDIVYATYILNGNDTLEMHTILFHQGGAFTDTLMVGVTGPSWSFVVGDFNNDKIPDLFVVNASGTGQAFLGKGDGTFSAAGRPFVASDGFLVTPPFVAGDFDHDGNVDIATRLTTIGPDVLLFLWGDGQGNFTGQIIASDNSFYLSTGDVNGDGVPDILASGGFGYMSVTLGRHDRNFPSSKLLLNAPVGALSSGNVFNSGYHDILVSGNGDCATLVGTPGVIYHFQPNGAPVAQGTAPACTSVLVDLEGDGIADLVGFSQSTIYIWKGDGTGMFQGPVAEIPVTGSQVIQDFVFRDMDGDGHKDIVVAGAILYGMGNLQFKTVQLPVTLNQRFLVGDFDGDGIPDIVISGGVLFGQGNRAFTAATGSVPTCWSGYLLSPAIGDMNGDGKDDIVCGAGATGLEIYIGAGRSGFTQYQALTIPGGSIVNTVSLGDFNADGRLDIAVGTLGGDDVVLLTNNGNGEFQISSYAIGVSPVLSIVGDFNNDGSPDLAFLNYGYDYKQNAVEVLLHK
jgi:hypothetical protein